MTQPKNDQHQRDDAVRRVVSLLAAAEYEAIAGLSPAGRLNATDLSDAVAGYGRTLLPLPSHAVIDYVTIEGTSALAWSVRVPLHTREEGRSDLTLDLTIRQQGTRYLVELDDLHVL
ncbi:MAG TPA: hypothetical protein VFX78_02155 [Candidatus Eisenbacteria bacterium]|nr:hypothetical protein [Candidatus Eisenbacteria bacterium]